MVSVATGAVAAGDLARHPDDKPSDTTATSTDDPESTAGDTTTSPAISPLTSGTSLPGNPIVHAILVGLAAVIWLVIQAGKAALIALAALIAVTLSLADLMLQLLVMPFVLLARAFGVMQWPVQIEREKKHFRTEHADGFDAAATLRDELAAQIQSGALAPEPAEPAPNPAPSS
jgi:hypothetical protein